MWLAGLLAFGLAFVALDALAVGSGPIITPLPGGGWAFEELANQPRTPPGPTWSNTTAGGAAGARASFPLTLQGPGGPLAVQVVRGVSASQILGAAARCLALANPYCIGAAAVALAFAQHRINQKAAVPGSVVPDGVLDYDPGTVRTTQTVYTASTASGWGRGIAAQTSVVSAQDALAKELAAIQASSPLWACGGGGVGCNEYREYGCSANHCELESRNRYSNTNAWPAWSWVQTISASSASALACPASTDFSNPAYNIPAGGAVGPDGLCPTARYGHVPYTEAQATAKVTGTSDYAPMARNISDAGQDTANVPVATSGPASQTGVPSTTTTTDPGGVVTTKTVTPTYQITYGDTISYTTTNTTVSCVSGGSCSTTITTTTPPASDPLDPCVVNPTRAGCMLVGSPPVGGDVLPTQNIDMSVGLVPGFGPSTMACPAPRTLTLVSGATFALPFDLVCQFAAGLRPVILALAWFGALVFVVHGVRRNA